ncbi:unnamed protein product [Polarella glacialis]|uniref:Sacsin/Nov domain-containing protein n=1 Tax=Polarella glacialis TaxID=89957 RepID=A0A813E2Z1_POLGL|nr:unnamed protein product [Polarella glacialis]
MALPERDWDSIFARHPEAQAHHEFLSSAWREEDNQFADSSEPNVGMQTWSPRRVHCAQVLQKITSGRKDLQDLIGDDSADDLLEERPAEEWADVINDVCCQMPATTSFTRSSLRLLRGWVTLAEALHALGPEWSPAALAIQGLAQQRLLAACGAGLDCIDWQQPLSLFVRSGASLFHADHAGRLPAHLAVISGSDVLGQLVRSAPTALLIADAEGQTPLDLLEGSSLLGDRGCEAGVIEALVHAALICVASLPEQTVRLLKQHPSAHQVWELLAEASGCSTLKLLGESPGPDSVDKSISSAKERESLSSARLQYACKSVCLLEVLSADHERKLEELEPTCLKLELSRRKELLREQEESHGRQVASLESELRRLRGVLAQRDDELLALTSRASRLDSAPLDCPDAFGTRKPVAHADAEAEATASAALSEAAVDLNPGRASAPVLTEDAVGLVESSSSSSPEAVIRGIRRKRLLGTNLAEVPEELRQGIVEMRASLSAAVDRLALDLYESEAHFLQELLQNADDNRYAEEEAPAVHFTLVDGAPGFSGPFFYSANNELGLSEIDVCSICDVSRSSKPSPLSGPSTATGCKGVGWKSVFCICDSPHVLSGAWRFRFSGKHGLGMITPEWIDDAEYALLPAEVRAVHQKGSTVFFLPLKGPQTARSIEAEMHVMQSDAAQLLFLRRIKQISLTSPGHGLVQLSRPGHGVGYRVIIDGSSCQVGQEKQHLEADHSQVLEVEFEVCAQDGVVVALPLVEDPVPQRVFAFLPVRPVGFRFAAHAPFHLTASRDDLHRSAANSRLRDAIAPAFLQACTQSSAASERALKYVGTEPADPFWFSVRSTILAGLQGVPCIQTSHGLVEPRRCLLRGDAVAAKWVPDDILFEACGLHFADDASLCDVLRDMGVPTFSFSHLTDCMRHMGDARLHSLWCHPSRSQMLSDIYGSLADGLQADPSRLAEVRALRIFPIEVCALSNDSAASDLARGVAWSTADNVHSEHCKEMPLAWQLLLVKTFNRQVQLSRPGRNLLSLIGMVEAEEEEVTQAALRWLLGQGVNAESATPPFNATWAALAILRHRFLKGQAPHHGPGVWAELAGAVLLPSALGELVPAGQLRLTSFLGVREKLPQGVLENVYAFAGIAVPSPPDLQQQQFQPCALPPPKLQGLEWDLGWEVFFWTLGCVPADPGGRSGDCFVEATMGLGGLLSSGAFWQQALETTGAMTYLEAMVKTEANRFRRWWLSRLPVNLGDEVVALEDLFVYEVFRPLMGSYLLYLEGAPQDNRVQSLLRALGITVEIDKQALLRCLRWLRAGKVQDVALAADLYVQLERSGWTCSAEELILVPGAGYVAAGDCVWNAFQSPLLQRCCRWEAISEHYGRFGQDVCTVLQRWVRHSPQTDVAEICDALYELISCAKADARNQRRPYGRSPVSPSEASSGLLSESIACVEALGELCLAEESAASRQSTGNPRATMARQCFEEHRMILLPKQASSGSGDGGFRLLYPHEAFWAVEAELQQHSCASSALERHYGQGQFAVHFFTQAVGVTPLLTRAGLGHLMTLQVAPHWNFNNLGHAPPTPGLPGSEFAEGVDQGMFAAPHPLPPHAVHGLAVDAPRNLARALAHLQGVEPVSFKQELRDTPLRPGGGCSHGPGSRAPGERIWVRCSAFQYFPLFALEGAVVPHEVLRNRIDEAAVYRICMLLGIGPDRVAFAFDPSGRCVCEQRLFLDVRRVPSTLERQADFWLLELAHALAHQAVGPEVNETFIQMFSLILRNHVGPL